MERRELKAKTMMLSSLDYSKPCVKSSSEGSFENDIVELADIDRELEGAINRYVNLRLKIISQIEQLPEPYCSVLYSHYVDLKPFNIVAETLGYSYVHTCRLHGRALQLFQSVIEG